MEKENEFIVYIHTNTKNNKVYIGQTCLSVESRWGNNGQGYLHKKSNGEYSQPLFARAIDKYGWDSFTHEVISDHLTKDEADSLEKELIEKYDSTNPDKGYNIREGGANGHLSDNTKSKLSEGVQGKYIGENNPFYGRTHSEESKKRMSESHKMNHPDNSGEKNPMYHHVYTEEELEKKRISALGHFVSQNTKDKIAASNSKWYYICIETGEKYESAKDASIKTGIPRSSITCAGNGRLKMAGGYHWAKELKNIDKK